MSEFGISHTAALNEASVDYSRRPYAALCGLVGVTSQCWPMAQR